MLLFGFNAISSFGQNDIFSFAIFQKSVLGLSKNAVVSTSRIDMS